MKYISVDIETTGLFPEEHQIIEFGAIIEDSNDPKSYEESKKFRRILLSSDGNYQFTSYAAKINAGLIETISDIENGKGVSFDNNPNLSQGAYPIEQLLPDFKIWLLANGFKENSKGLVEIVAAGKNFASFDRKFIENSSGRFSMESQGLKFSHRSLDPSGYYIDWKNDVVPPSTETCKSRADIAGEVKHNALADAWDVIELLRKQYSQNPYYAISLAR